MDKLGEMMINKNNTKTRDTWASLRPKRTADAEEPAHEEGSPVGAMRVPKDKHDAIFDLNPGDIEGGLFTYPGPVEHLAGNWDTKVLVVQRAGGGFEVAVIVDKKSGWLLKYKAPTEAGLFDLLNGLRCALDMIGHGPFCPYVYVTIRDAGTGDEIVSMELDSPLQRMLQERYPCPYEDTDCPARWD